MERMKKDRSFRITIFKWERYFLGIWREIKKRELFLKGIMMCLKIKCMKKKKRRFVLRNQKNS